MLLLLLIPCCSATVGESIIPTTNLHPIHIVEHFRLGFVAELYDRGPLLLGLSLVVAAVAAEPDSFHHDEYR